MSPPATPSLFEQLNAFTSVTEDTQTLWRIIDFVAWNFDDDAFSREDPGFKELPYVIDEDRLRRAIPYIESLKWLNLQKLRNSPITSLRPLRLLRKLTGLCITDNQIASLEPISHLALDRLICVRNQIEDISPLVNCKDLKELELQNNPLKSLAPLEELPNLTQLSVTADQIQALSMCKTLPAVQTLTVWSGESMWSVGDLPEMPQLSRISAHGVQSLEGISRYELLSNLSADGSFSDVGHVSKLQKLTHVHLCSTGTLDLSPLASCLSLRSIGIVDAIPTNCTHLDKLPALREFKTYPASRTVSQEVKALRSTLSSWDQEFRALQGTLQPDPHLLVISQADFDYYDTKEPFGLLAGESNREMIDSERGWLLGNIEQTLSIDLTKDEDFTLPWTGGFRRSDTVCIYTLQAYEMFREIVRRIQVELCSSRNEWIIYFQSSLWEHAEDLESLPPEFTVWLYRDRIVTTEEFAPVVQELLTPV